MDKIRSFVVNLHIGDLVASVDWLCEVHDLHGFAVVDCHEVEWTEIVKHLLLCLGALPRLAR